MKIALITPAPLKSRNGNRNTAVRWAAFLRELKHRVRIEQEWNGAAADVMIALHARRSHDSIARYAQAFPERPLVVALTGTDLYRDIRIDADAQASLELASLFIVLQELGARALPAALRRKVRVIYQSALPPPLRPAPGDGFELVVSGHLREEKDPFRAAAALARLPQESTVRVTHIGRAMTPEMEREACAWMAREPRYRWLGEVGHARALRVLARSRGMIISSRMEGGANVVSEALACRVPVLASRIDGNVGMLGAHYPGYFRVEDERALARLMGRMENSVAFRNELRAACAARAVQVRPDRERAALARLLDECVRPVSRSRAAA